MTIEVHALDYLRAQLEAAQTENEELRDKLDAATECLELSTGELRAISIMGSSGTRPMAQDALDRINKCLAKLRGEG